MLEFKIRISGRKKTKNFAKYCYLLLNFNKSTIRAHLLHKILWKFYEIQWGTVFLKVFSLGHTPWGRSWLCFQPWVIFCFFTFKFIKNVCVTFVSPFTVNIVINNIFDLLEGQPSQLQGYWNVAKAEVCRRFVTRFLLENFEMFSFRGNTKIIEISGKEG